jgi:hypothetical protein
MRSTGKMLWRLFLVPGCRTWNISELACFCKKAKTAWVHFERLSPADCTATTQMIAD